MTALLFGAGCFGLGLAAARLAGWGRSPPPPEPLLSIPTGAPVSSEQGPLIYVDAGSITVMDASLKLDPPAPPRLPTR